MIDPSDADYLATKLVKAGTSHLAFPFDALAARIHSEWGTRPLNVVYAPRSSLHPPRINVVFEFKAEADQFRAAGSINYDREKQARTVSFLRELSANQPGRFDFERMFAIFTAFAPIAMIEANSRISWWKLRQLKSRIADPSLWRIRHNFQSATFMFYTDQQRDESKVDGRQREYSRAYYDLLKPNDEFGYLNAETFAASFDSKETLDRDYGGRWFNYDR